MVILALPLRHIAPCTPCNDNGMQECVTAEASLTAATSEAQGAEELTDCLTAELHQLQMEIGVKQVRSC